jgi:hypothetical protein
MRNELFFDDGGMELEQYTAVAVPNLTFLAPFWRPGTEVSKMAAELYRMAYEQARVAVTPSLFDRCRSISLN